MCYTPEASQRALLFNTLTCMIIYGASYNREDFAIAIFFAFVGLMQLWDWIFWENLRPNKTNAFFTKVAMLSNHLQPLVFAAAVAGCMGRVGSFTSTVLILYLLAIAWYTIENWSRVDYTLVGPDSSPSLLWKWNDQPHAGIVYSLFLSSLVVTSLENFSYPTNWALAAASSLTFWFSLQYKGIHSVGRMWCNIGAYVALVGPVVRLMLGSRR